MDSDIVIITILSYAIGATSWLIHEPKKQYVSGKARCLHRMIPPLAAMTAVAITLSVIEKSTFVTTVGSLFALVGILWPGLVLGPYLYLLRLSSDIKKGSTQKSDSLSGSLAFEYAAGPKQNKARTIEANPLQSNERNEQYGCARVHLPANSDPHILPYYALTALGTGLAFLRVELFLLGAATFAAVFFVRPDPIFASFVTAIVAGLAGFIYYKPDIYFLYLTVGIGLFITRMVFVKGRARRWNIIASRILYVGLIALLVTAFYLNRYVYRGYGRTEVFLRGTGEFKVVALTFDDGPDPVYTPEILQVLRKYGVKATFFMVGKHAERWPETVRLVAQDGHEIGNHSYSHRQMLPLSREKIEDEVLRCDETLHSMTGEQPTLLRPPRGLLGSQGLEVSKNLRYTVALWSLSSEDWTEIAPKHIAARVISRTKPGDIILFHDSGDLIRSEGGKRSSTVQALDYIIPALQEEGYVFVTVTQMMMMSSLTSGD